MDGVDHYHGSFGSPGSHERYERAIAEKIDATKRGFDLSVAEVLYRYRDFACSNYQIDGKPSKELQAVRYSLRPVRQLYSGTKLRDIGPLALKSVRQSMIDAGLSRKPVREMGRQRRACADLRLRGTADRGRPAVRQDNGPRDGTG